MVITVTHDETQIMYVDYIPTGCNIKYDFWLQIYAYWKLLCYSRIAYTL